MEKGGYTQLRSKSISNLEPKKNDAKSIQMLSIRGRLNSTGNIWKKDVETPFVHQTRMKRTTDFVRKASQPRLLGDADLQFARKMERQNTMKSMSEVEKKQFEENLPTVETEEDNTVVDDNFKFNHEGFTDSEADNLLLIHGRNELAESTVPLWYVFVSQLWQPMPIMIWCASAVELSISNYIDMGILLFIQFANATIGFYEIAKAGNDALYD